MSGLDVSCCKREDGAAKTVEMQGLLLEMLFVALETRRRPLNNHF